MAKPRVFVSSTFYDLKFIRNDIERFIKEMGYDPILNERGAIPYGSEERLEDYCYKEVELTDILVAIIGGKYGSQSRDNHPYSITQMEIKTALKLSKQVYVFIEKSVYSEYKTYLNNKDLSEIKYNYVDDTRVFSFVEEIENLPNNNTISTFESSQDVIFYLKEQWAGLFQRFLQQQSKQSEARAIENIHSTAQTLNKLVSYLTEERKNSDNIIKEILLSSHPIFGRLKEVTRTPYPIFFTFQTEMEAWLSARKFVEVDVFDQESDSDEFSEYKCDMNKSYFRLAVNKCVFDDTGKLRVFTATEWNDEWVTISEEKKVEINDDDLPF